MELETNLRDICSFTITFTLKDTIMTLCYDLCIDIGLVGTFSMEISIFAICEGSFPALINIGHFGLIHQLSTNDQAAD